MEWWEEQGVEAVEWWEEQGVEAMEWREEQGVEGMEWRVEDLEPVGQGILPLEVPGGVGTRRQGVVAGGEGRSLGGSMITVF